MLSIANPMDDPTQPYRPLPMGVILRDAVLIAWKHRIHCIRLMVIPVALLTILDVVGSYWLDPSHPTIDGLKIWFFDLFTYWAFQFLILTIFAIPCHRLFLLGTHEVSEYGLHRWTFRDIRFLLILLLLYIAIPMALGICYFFFLVFGWVVADLMGNVDGESLIDSYFVNFLIGIGFLPFAYLVGRLGLSLPATAVDFRSSLRENYSLSACNGWRLAIVIGTLPFVASLLVSIGFNWVTGESQRWGFLFFENVLYYLVAVVEVAILSLSFRYLSGFQSPSEAIAGSSEKAGVLT